MRHSKIYLFSINGNVASDKIVDIYKIKHTELGLRLFCYWVAVTSLAHVGPHVGGFIPVRLGHGPAAVLVWSGCGWGPPTCGSSPWSGSSRAGSAGPPGTPRGGQPPGPPGARRGARRRPPAPGDTGGSSLRHTPRHTPRSRRTRCCSAGGAGRSSSPSSRHTPCWSLLINCVTKSHVTRDT